MVPISLIQQQIGYVERRSQAGPNWVGWGLYAASVSAIAGAVGLSVHELSAVLGVVGAGLLFAALVVGITRFD